jgi:hypothetical protein
MPIGQEPEKLRLPPQKKTLAPPCGVVVDVDVPVRPRGLGRRKRTLAPPAAQKKDPGTSRGAPPARREDRGDDLSDITARVPQAMDTSVPVTVLARIEQHVGTAHYRRP